MAIQTLSTLFNWRCVCLCRRGGDQPIDYRYSPGQSKASVPRVGSERYTFFWDIAIVDISKWISNIASCDAIFDFWISNIASCDAISKMWCDISFFEISPLSISQSGYGTSYHAMQCFGYLIYHHVMQCVDLMQYAMMQSIK